MRRTTLLVWALGAVVALLCAALPAWAGPADGPFAPDEHTLLLYHFDEPEGDVAVDSSGHGQDGTLLGAKRAPGRFGGGVWLDGKGASVFRKLLPAIRGIRATTVECWFNQEGSGGRRFLVGLDVGFHFEVDEGTYAAMSIYNQGGGVPNAEGRPHHQVSTPIGLLRPRWHRLAATYDGKDVTFFLDGILKGRVDAADDFALGVESRGLWVGSYVGSDFWFQGTIDEVRVSDCARYDPEKRLSPGERVFEMASPERPLPTDRAVRPLTKQGTAQLSVTLHKRYGSNAAGWVYLKPPGRPAAIVGKYAVEGLADGAESTVSFDVSDEDLGAGTYLVGLEQTDSGAYVSLVGAKLARGAEVLAEWSGEAKSRRTFSPPMLAPLRGGAEAPGADAQRRVLLPTESDRRSGSLIASTDDPAQPTSVYGEGQLEWWLDVPADAQYDVFLRYASGGSRPCDIVVDGDDLHPFNMCARNATPGAGAANALWERQGAVRLARGLHWIRLQDVLPEIVALRLEPTSPTPPPAVPWGRFPVPGGSFLGDGLEWRSETAFGSVSGAKLANVKGSLEFRAEFGNRRPEDLFAGDCVRFVHEGKWDLEPFGRLRFMWEGTGSEHVVALRLIDAKGDEKLLWRARDVEAGVHEVAVPISFEGNDVFDPGRVTAIHIGVDEGNMRPTEVSNVRGGLTNLRFERRDDLLLSEDDQRATAAGLGAVRQLAVPAGLGAWLREPPPLRMWARPVVPEEHPLYSTTNPPPVTRATMGYNLHFTGARDISTPALDDFHRFYDFGDVCWPHIGICPLRGSFPSDAAYQKALADFERQLEIVRDRGLYLFDIWGYVPNNEAGPTPVVAPEHKEILLRVFGDKFLGFDNGEQDGRYIGSYADRGPETNRKEGWEDFVRWDEGICHDSQNYMNSTGSLNFSHYYAERGCRTLGLETAQGLPSDTLMFAFLRGASKQYGRLTTQATSIWNRFGYNLYHDRKTDGGNGYGFGPHKGCSLSLHQRLFFQSYLGGDSIVGSETGQFTADRLENGAPELSPLGRQHLDIREWAEKHPDRGVLHTPVAFMLDFYNGWNMPRHLYRADKYKVWGKLPYEKGDYLTDQVFRLVWPGYEDASYLRNERGFVCDTPYGDSFDVITNRCHPSVLDQYTSIMLLGDVEITPEVAGNLTRFVEGGGDLLLDARNARQLPATLTGVTIGDEARGHASRLTAADGAAVFGESPYTYSRLSLAGASGEAINEAGHPLLAVHRIGKGRVIACAVDYWMTDRLTYAQPDLVNMEPPYKLLEGLRSALGTYFASLCPVHVNPLGLNVRTCFLADEAKRMLIGLTNSDLFADWSGSVEIRTGEPVEVTDLRTGERLRAGRTIPVRVPAGDVVILDVRMR